MDIVVDATCRAKRGPFMLGQALFDELPVHLY